MLHAPNSRSLRSWVLWLKTASRGYRGLAVDKFFA